MTAAPNVLIAGIGGASLGADHCVLSVLALCRRRAMACIVPGGEAPTKFLTGASGDWRPPASGSRPTPLPYFGEPRDQTLTPACPWNAYNRGNIRKRFGATPLVGARRWHDPGLQAADRG